jgi:polygalacturonase
MSARKDEMLNNYLLKYVLAATCLTIIDLRLSSAAGADLVIDARTQNVIGDGATLNTPAIQTAIDSLSVRGGGVLSFPAGHYLTGTIQLKDNVRLRLDDQAVLLGSLDTADYRNVDPFIDGTGSLMGYALIVADGASHVGIEGAGTIDGQGKALKAAEKQFTIRPFLIRWLHCTDITVKDVHLTDPGAWTMNFFQCAHVSIDHVNIRSAASRLANNDGIDLDSSQDIQVADCDIESGDDALCIKATSPQPSRNITITNCTLKTRCNGIKFGTESIGDFDHIQASNCRLRDIGLAGIALYSVDGAQMHDVKISDIDMNGVTVPISLPLGARLKTFRPGDHPRPVGTLHDITLENIHAIGAKEIGLLINGIPEHPIESLHLKNIDITLAGGGTTEQANVQLTEEKSTYPEVTMFGKTMPAMGAYIRHVRGITCENIMLSATRADSRPTAVLIDVQGATAADFAAHAP